jgi:hypothetical protein
MQANEINAYCAICNEPYHVCKSCLEIKSFKPWRTVTDTFEHYKVFLAVHRYTVSKDKETAKTELQNCDLNDLENFRPEIQKAIHEIIDDENKNVEIIIENNVIQETEEQTEIKVAEVKPQKKSTRKTKNVDKTNEASDENIE